MAVLSLLSVPFHTVPRGPKGAVLGETMAHLNGWPLTVTLTDGEVHIAFADRDGPRFAVDLHQVVLAAVKEIEGLLGLTQKGKR